MKYLVIYILIGSLTLIANIILLVIYLKINYFSIPKKTTTKPPEEVHSDDKVENIMEDFENTEYVDVDDNEKNNSI